MSKLTPKQQRFVDEYLADLNAAAAARRAGYAAKRADAIGHENLRKPVIAAAIQAAIEARAERTGITADQVLESLAAIGFADMRAVAAWGPEGVRVLPSESLSREAAAAVAETRSKDTQFGRDVTVKLHDKVRALELIGKHLGMFVDNVNNRFPDGAPPVQVYLPANGRDNDSRPPAGTTSNMKESA